MDSNAKIIALVSLFFYMVAVTKTYFGKSDKNPNYHIAIYFMVFAIFLQISSKSIK